MHECLIDCFEVAKGVRLMKSDSDGRWFVNQTNAVNKLYPRYDYMRPFLDGIVLISTCGDNEICIIMDEGDIISGAGYFTTDEATYFLGGIAHFTKGLLRGNEAVAYLDTLYSPTQQNKEAIKRFVLGDKEGYLELADEVIEVE